MPEMRCAGCMEAGTVVFMDSVLCGECFFRQTVVARAVRGSFDAAIGRPPVPVPVAPAGPSGDLVARAITRLQRDLNDLLSVLTPAEAVVAAQRAAAGPAERRVRARRRPVLDQPAPRGGGEMEPASAAP